MKSVPGTSALLVIDLLIVAEAAVDGAVERVAVQVVVVVAAIEVVDAAPAPDAVVAPTAPAVVDAAAAVQVVVAPAAPGPARDVGVVVEAVVAVAAAELDPRHRPAGEHRHKLAVPDLHVAVGRVRHIDA